MMRELPAGTVTVSTGRRLSQITSVRKHRQDVQKTGQLWIHMCYEVLGFHKRAPPWGGASAVQDRLMENRTYTASCHLLTRSSCIAVSEERKIRKDQMTTRRHMYAMLGVALLLVVGSAFGGTTVLVDGTSATT